MRKMELLALAGYLPTIPAEQFNMNYWKKLQRVTGQDGPECKTVACAAGHAVIAKIAPKGLRFSRHGDTLGNSTVCSIRARHEGRELVDYKAIAAKYDIPREDARELFGAPRAGHRTRKQVADEIRAYALDPANADAAYDY